jgi:hypothetical protein
VATGILSSKMGSWSLASSLLIIIIYYDYICWLCKIYYRDKERTIVEGSLRKPVQATNNFSPLLVVYYTQHRLIVVIIILSLYTFIKTYIIQKRKKGWAEKK